MELNSFEKPGGGASVARPALDRVVAAAREGGLDLFDVIIPSRTWRIQDRVSAPPSVLLQGRVRSLKWILFTANTIFAN